MGGCCNPACVLGCLISSAGVLSGFSPRGLAWCLVCILWVFSMFGLLGYCCWWFGCDFDCRIYCAVAGLLCWAVYCRICGQFACAARVVVVGIGLLSFCVGMVFAWCIAASVGLV